MRCKWCNLNNPVYVSYHDNEWGALRTDDRYLFEMLVLESFQAGLSWECILNKRDAFRVAYDNFSLDKVCSYDEEKINELIGNSDIVRNKLKIRLVLIMLEFLRVLFWSLVLFIVIYVILLMVMFFMRVVRLSLCFLILFLVI